MENFMGLHQGGYKEFGPVTTGCRVYELWGLIMLCIPSL